MSIRGGVMVGVVWLFRFLFRGRISGRFFSVLWLLAALRLALPFAVPSQAGIYGLLWRRVPESVVQSDAWAENFPAVEKGKERAETVSGRKTEEEAKAAGSPESEREPGPEKIQRYREGPKFRVCQ